MLNRLTRTLLRRAGVTRELGRLRSLIAAGATVSAERDRRLEERLDELEAELANVAAVHTELYVGSQ